MPFELMKMNRKMFIRRVIFPAIFFALIAASSAVFAATEDAAQFVQRLGDQTIDTLRAPYLTLDERRDQFRGLLSQGFDIPFIGRFVIGRYWRGATSEQRGDYMALYSEFFLNTYTSRLGESDGQTFVVTGARAANAKDVVVRSLLNRAGGQPFVTDWREHSTPRPRSASTAATASSTSWWKASAWRSPSARNSPRSPGAAAWMGCWRPCAPAPRIFPKSPRSINRHGLLA